MRACVCVCVCVCRAVNVNYYLNSNSIKSIFTVTFPKFD